MDRRQSLALLLAGAAALPAVAQDADARVYGVVSLIADVLTVTGFASTTGTLLRDNQTETIELKTDDVERAVLRTSVIAINDSRTGKAVPLLFDDGGVYAAARTMVSGNEVRLPDMVTRSLQGQKATHLLLVTKHRGPANMRAFQQDLGSGVVEGLGFYIDRVKQVTLIGTSEVATGYIAPHAFLRYSLIDLRSNQVIRSRTVTASRVMSASRTAAGAHPWDVLDSRAKMQALVDLITSESPTVLREVLGS